MKNQLAVLAVALSLGLTLALDAEAKRLGGARNSGMQRQQTTQPATTPTNPAASPTQAAPVAGTAAAAAAPAAAAAKRSWAGPLAGLAAGLGIAALASYLGFGEAMANMMMIVLLVVAAVAIFGFIMRKRAASAATPAYAGAGAGGGSPAAGRPLLGTRIGSALGGVPASQAQASAIPADFDAEGFARNAKAQFMHLQAANDARDLAKLRDYLSPEMYEVVREEVDARGDTPQKTEVFGLEARVLEVAEDANGYVVSVRFTGSVRDQHGAAPDDLDEVWHLAKPKTGSAGWVIAGIQQVTAG
jgi:predicted lipid-binding transport protein (Tim44 family)